MKNVLFIVGSMRGWSFNRQMAKVAEEMIADRCKVKYLDYKELPYMNQDLEMQCNPPWLGCARRSKTPTRCGYHAGVQLQLS